MLLSGSFCGRQHLHSAWRRSLSAGTQRDNDNEGRVSALVHFLCCPVRACHEAGACRRALTLVWDTCTAVHIATHKRRSDLHHADADAGRAQCHTQSTPGARALQTLQERGTPSRTESSTPLMSWQALSTIRTSRQLSFLRVLWSRKYCAPCRNMMVRGRRSRLPDPVEEGRPKSRFWSTSPSLPCTKARAL